METRKQSMFLMILGVFGLGIVPLHAFAAPPDNYTAKMLMEGMTMPIARMGTKMRSENPMLQGMVNIMLPDAHKMIIMSTVNKTYIEQPLEEKGVPSLDDPRVVIEKKDIGADTIDGHPCTKYAAVIYMKDKAAEKYQAVLWEAKDLGGLVIRNETTLPPGKGMGKKGKIVNELKEIKVGAAKTAMFEIPDGYRKAGTIMEVMGGAGNMEEMFKGMKRK